jgi:hypothetical protein
MKADHRRCRSFLCAERGRIELGVSRAAEHVLATQLLWNLPAASRSATVPVREARE